LHKHGLDDALAAVAVRPRSGDMRRWEDWSLLSSSPLGDDVVAEYGFPYYDVHRAELHRVLAARVPPGQIVLGRRLIGVEESPSGTGAVLRFADGSSAVADVVVGADGVHSVVREALFGAEDPRFSGYSAWWGLVPAHRVADLGLPLASTVVMGPRRHFVYYSVSAGRFVNWVGVAPTQTWTLESWTAPGRPAQRDRVPPGRRRRSAPARPQPRRHERRPDRASQCLDLRLRRGQVMASVSAPPSR
jgi:salicylate hydroxylase